MRYIHIRVAHNTISIYLIVYTKYIYTYIYIYIDRYIRAQNKLRSIIMSLNVLFIFVIAYRSFVASRNSNVLLWRTSLYFQLKKKRNDGAFLS